MATVDSQQGWLPDDGTNKGCSQGFCSIYCPQWCYVLFPPPSPLSLVGAEDDSGTALSPFVIAIISIFAAAFLLASYYFFISKHHASLSFYRRPIYHEERAAAASVSGEEGVARVDEDNHVPQSTGLEEALMNTVWRYKKGKELVEGTDCSVCLSEFRDGEKLRLLPKCNHAFHLQCIDAWLKSQPNCPLCRDNVMSLTTAKMRLERGIAAMVPEQHEQEIIVIIEDAESGEEEEDSNRTDIVEIVVEEGSESYQRPVSIADVLQVSMDEECMTGKDCELAEGSRSWRQSRGGQSSVGQRSGRLRCVMSPVRMKRTISGGRLFISRGGRGRTSPLSV